MEQQRQFVELDDNDSNGKNAGFRCWMASGPDNEIPKGNLKVVGSKILNEETKFYLLTVQQEDGTLIDCPVYKRDYRRCSSEWGKNPGSWGAVNIKRDGMRFAFYPSETPVTEEKIGEPIGR